MPGQSVDLAVQFDFSEFVIWGDQMGAAADQLPFALSLSLNQSLTKARQVMVNEWPTKVETRNVSFIGTSLRMEFSRKDSLVASIFDRLKLPIIQTLATGGRRRPFKAQRLAIPLKSWVNRGPHGVIAKQQPARIAKDTPKRALRIVGNRMFVGESGRLHLRYTFERQAPQPKMLNFYEDFVYVLTNGMRTGFAEAMQRAMRSRK